MASAPRKITIGAAPPYGTPWGTIAQVLQTALEPMGYEASIEGEASAGRGPRLMSEGLTDIGVVQSAYANTAFAGNPPYQEAGPYPNLRIIASIVLPAWLAIAVKRETWITDLSQIRERQLPVQIYTLRGRPYFETMLDYYGFSDEFLASIGGKYVTPGTRLNTVAQRVNMGTEGRDGEIDVFMSPMFLGYAPEVQFLRDATTYHQYRFLSFPEELIKKLCDEAGGEPGEIPTQFFPGVEAGLRSVSRPHHVIYCRTETPDELAYDVAKAADENRALFRQTRLPFSYAPEESAADHGIGLHPGASRYYQEIDRL